MIRQVSRGPEATSHEAGHGEQDPGAWGTHRVLGVGTQAPVLHPPRKGAFDSPAPGQNLEALCVESFAAADSFTEIVGPGGGCVCDVAPCICTRAPDCTDPTGTQ